MLRRAVGPLGRAVEAIEATKGDQGVEAAEENLKPRHGKSFGRGANPLVLLRRTAFVTSSGGLDKAGMDATLAWAANSALGQDRTHLAELSARRTHALDRLASLQRRCVERLVADTEWRLAVGVGDRANAYELGLSMHGTYGWPVIPGSALKGMALAYACGEDPVLLRQVFGWPLPHLDPGPAGAAVGGVCFLDALPDPDPVTVHRDVLTPHVKPYYDDAVNNVRATHRRPPAEYHKPEVIKFLSVSGRFAIDIVGADPEHVRRAAQWVSAAGNELGAGAKTAAGYGYLQVSKRAYEGAQP